MSTISTFSSVRLGRTHAREQKSFLAPRTFILVFFIFVSFTTAFSVASPTEAAVYTSPPSNAGKWGVYPNCIAPAVGIEVHSWWDEDLNPASFDDAPRHIHMAACMPNARDIQNTIVSKISQKEHFVVRVVVYNNPSTVSISRWAWESNVEEVIPMNVRCSSSVPSYKIVGGRGECTWYVDMTVDPATAQAGIDEIRLTPNIPNHDTIGTRQFNTLNFQLPIAGKSGTYRSTVDPIGRSWYEGLEYANITVGYMDHFKAGDLGKSVPVVSGVVPIRVKSASLSGTVKVAIWEDTNHHAAPTAWRDAQVGDIHPSGGRLLFLNNGSFSGTFNWDTRGLTDGRHKLYFQSQETNEKGVQAGALLLFYDVCNSGSCNTPSPTFNFSLSSGGSRTVVRGQSVTNTVTNTLLSGTSQSTSYSASGLPSGATASFSPSSCSPSCSTTMTIATGASTPTGSYTVTIVGTAGTVIRTTPFTLTVNASSDTTAPSTPSNFSAAVVSDSRIDLSWSASTDNVGVLNYRLERCAGSSCTNFTQIATPTGTSYSNTGLSASTTYRYRVRAVDAAGNVSGYSNIASATTNAVDPPPPDPSDNTPPIVSITSPTNGVTLSGTVSVSASASDNVGVVDVRFFVDGALRATDVTAPYSFNWDTATAYNGLHIIAAVARDSAGNTGDSNLVNVTVQGGLTRTADLNADGVVNSLDWSIMNGQWNTAGPSADLNSDGIVNSFDWSVMNGRWGTAG
ncbi:MAG: Ig-like domain-containing protein [Patescibacteria group bacterium]